MDTSRYLQLQQTFSPFRFRDPHIRDGLAQALRETVDAFGGIVHMRLDTHVVLAHKI
jgi:hypothetical protein